MKELKLWGVEMYPVHIQYDIVGCDIISVTEEFHERFIKAMKEFEEVQEIIQAELDRLDK